MRRSLWLHATLLCSCSRLVVQAEQEVSSKTIPPQDDKHEHISTRETEATTVLTGEDPSSILRRHLRETENQADLSESSAVAAEHANAALDPAGGSLRRRLGPQRPGGWWTDHVRDLDRRDIWEAALATAFEQQSSKSECQQVFGSDWLSRWRRSKYDVLMDDSGERKHSASGDDHESSAGDDHESGTKTGPARRLDASIIKDIVRHGRSRTTRTLAKDEEERKITSEHSSPQSTSSERILAEDPSGSTAALLRARGPSSVTCYARPSFEIIRDVCVAKNAVMRSVPVKAISKIADRGQGWLQFPQGSVRVNTESLAGSVNFWFAPPLLQRFSKRDSGGPVKITKNDTTYLFLADDGNANPPIGRVKLDEHSLNSELHVVEEESLSRACRFATKKKALISTPWDVFNFYEWLGDWQNLIENLLLLKWNPADVELYVLLKHSWRNYVELTSPEARGPSRSILSKFGVDKAQQQAVGPAGRPFNRAWQLLFGVENVRIGTAAELFGGGGVCFEEVAQVTMGGLATFSANGGRAGSVQTECPAPSVILGSLALEGVALSRKTNPDADIAPLSKFVVDFPGMPFEKRPNATERTEANATTTTTTEAPKEPKNNQEDVVLTNGGDDDEVLEQHTVLALRTVFRDESAEKSRGNFRKSPARAGHGGPRSSSSSSSNEDHSRPEDLSNRFNVTLLLRKEAGRGFYSDPQAVSMTRSAIPPAYRRRWNVRALEISGRMTLRQQVEVGRTTQVLVGVVGAGMTLTLFLGEKGRIVVIYCGDRNIADGHYKTIAMMVEKEAQNSHWATSLTVSAEQPKRFHFYSVSASCSVDPTPVANAISAFEADVAAGLIPTEALPQNLAAVEWETQKAANEQAISDAKARKQNIERREAQRLEQLTSTFQAIKAQREGRTLPPEEVAKNPFLRGFLDGKEREKGKTKSTPAPAIAMSSSSTEQVSKSGDTWQRTALHDSPGIWMVWFSLGALERALIRFEIQGPLDAAILIFVVTILCYSFLLLWRLRKVETVD